MATSVAGVLLAGLVATGCATPLRPLETLGLSSDERVVEIVPASPEAAASAAFLRGRTLELDGDLQAAAEAYALALESDPESAELLGYLSDVWYRMADPERALEYAEQASTLAPDDPEATGRLVRIYLAMKQYDRVTALLEPAFEAGELDENGVHDLFELYLRLRQFDAAEHVAGRLIELDPESLRAYFALGRALAQQRRFDDAEQVFRRAQKLAPYDGRIFDALANLRQSADDPEGEIEILEQKLEVLPGDAGALLRIAQIREGEGNRLAAIRALETLVHHHANHVGALFQLGYFYFEAGRYDDAIERFERVSARSNMLRDPDYRHEVSYVLALAYFEAKRYPSVAAVLAGVPPGSKRYADARVLMARSFERRERYGEALAEAELALEIVPENVPVQVYVAGLVQRNGDLDAAVERMARLIEADPENVDLRYDLGLIYSSAGDEDRALEAMMGVVERDADHASALNYVGYTWADRGTRLDDAEAMIIRAVELRPEDGYIKDSLGWVRYKRGLKLLEEGRMAEARGAFEHAINDLEQALELLDEEDPVITFHLGDAYRSASRFADALRAYRRALELEPTDKDESEIRARIELLELQIGSVDSDTRP